MAALLNRDVKWFQTAAGIAAFKKITSLEDRIFFISEYLKCVINKFRQKQSLYEQFNDFELSCINKVTFSFAIFLADAIYNSDLPYATYPALIDEKQNPFFKSWVLHAFGKDNSFKPIYKSFTTIVKKENERRKNNAKTFKQELIDGIGTTSAREYSEQIFSLFPDTTIYDYVPSLQLIQLKNMWLFKTN